MAVIRGQPYVVRYIAWNIANNPPTPVTGDAANHTVHVDIDGGSSTPVSVTIIEIDATNRPGQYKFTLPGTHTNGNSIGVSIRSTTPNVFIQPITLLTEQGRLDVPVSSRAAPGQEMALVDNAISDAKIAPGAITADKIATEAITADKLAQGALKGTHLDSTALTAIASSILLDSSNRLHTNASGHVVVGGYATGQSPAHQLLMNPSNKLYTSSTGKVQVEGVEIGSDQINAIAQAAAQRVWDEPKSAHNITGTYGQLLDVAISSRQPSGPVTVGGYQSGQDPATLVWSHPVRTITQFQPEFADVIWNRQRGAVSRPFGSFGYMLDQAISSAVSDLMSQILEIRARVDLFQFSSSSGLPRVEVAAYEDGQSPGEQVLYDHTNKLQTTANGFVVADVVNDKSGYTIDPQQVAEIVDAVWDELRSGHNVAGSFGALLDAPVSSRQPAGPVTVGGYQSGQDPGSMVWAHPVRTLSTVLNVVQGGSTTIADQFWNRLRSADARPAGSFGEYIDMKLSDVAIEGASDWTPEEKQQIRHALGLDGSRQAPTGAPGLIQQIHERTSQLQFTGGNVHASVRAYGGGLSPSEQVLLNPSNRLYANSSGFVTVGVNTDKSGYSLSAAGIEQLVDAVWDEPKLGHDTPGTYGYFLDIAVSSRHPNTSVTVGGYVAGQSPADLLLLNPANRLATDSSGRVVVGSNADKAGYQLHTGQHVAIADRVWDTLRVDHALPGSFGEALDVKVSSRHPDAPVSVGGYQPGKSPAELLLTLPNAKLANSPAGGIVVSGYESGKSPGEQVLQNPARRVYLDEDGSVRVGGYASGQSPAHHVLATPSNKLATDTSGRVTVGANMDKSGYSLTSSERQSIAQAVWSYVLEGARSAAAFMRIMFSVLAGRRAVTPSDFTYYGVDGETVRVKGSVDGDKNREIQQLNGDS